MSVTSLTSKAIHTSKKSGSISESDSPVVVQVEELANELVDCVPCLDLHIHGQEESQEK